MVRIANFSVFPDCWSYCFVNDRLNENGSIENERCFGCGDEAIKGNNTILMVQCPWHVPSNR